MRPFVNTVEFKREAMNFLKHGYYTNAPEGSRDYTDYWDEQLRRCQEGYSVGGVKITGHHYGYMNFAQILLTPDEDDMITKNKRKRGRSKVRSFPDFWDGDYDYFWTVEIARYGMDEKEYQKLGLETRILDLGGGLNVIISKARRKGFSYKNGWIAANNYNTVREMTTLIGAYEKKYLYPEGTMSMASNYLNFLNEHTAWAKRRQAVDKQDHKKASYYEMVNGINIEKGYKSQIIAVTFKDNPDAARGKDASLILLDECGAFDNLKDAYAATLPTIKDGSYTTGQILMYGTGGDMEGGTIDFESMFYNPEPYELIPFENIWDEGSSGTSCGFFFPDYWNKSGFMDSNGNSRMKEAKDHEIAKRAYKKKTAKDPSQVDKYITEHPFNPREAFMQVNSNLFPVATLSEWRNRLSSTGLYLNMGLPGTLIETKEGVKFQPNTELRPVTKFPHDRGDDLTGCVVQYQAPYKVGDRIPNDLYFIAHDPYAQDTTGGMSLGAAYVIKRINPFTKPDDMIVASYVGRPSTQDEYNRNLFLLAKYYGCKIGFENDRGEVIPYAKRYKQLNFLMEEVEIFDASTNFLAKKLGRKYGLSMGSKQRKQQAEIYLRDWLLTPRSKNEDGDQVLNLHYIYDIGLLDELIKYNSKGNFDRASSLLVAMFYMIHLFNRNVQNVEENEGENDFFNRPWFV